LYLPSLIITFIILTLLMSFVYFYMFAKSQERYVRFWGLCWVAYSFSLLFLVLSIIKTLLNFWKSEKYSIWQIYFFCCSEHMPLCIPKYLPIGIVLPFI